MQRILAAARMQLRAQRRAPFRRLAGSQFLDCSHSFSTSSDHPSDQSGSSGSSDQDWIGSSDQFGSVESAPASDLVAAVPTQEIVDIAETIIEPLGKYPPDLLVYALEHMHTAYGLEWYQTIICATAVTRFCLAPLAIKMMRAASRMGRCAPEVAELTDKMKAGKITQEGYGNGVKAAYAKQGISNPFLAMGLPFLQFPVFISFFFGVRKLPDYFDLSEGGALWFTDLSVCDPYYILPFTTSLSFWLAFELNADGTKNSTMPQMAWVMRAMALGMMPITASFPTALLVYWNTNNFFSLFQVAVLKIPGLKAKFGILEPLPLPTVQIGNQIASKSALNQSKPAGLLEQDKLFSNPPPGSARTTVAKKKKKRRAARRRRR